MEIDFVITWVDGNDPKWRAEKKKYSATKDDDDNAERYRDWDILKYWFRAVETYAPWVRKIHFVTAGQTPEWMDVTNEKLHLVNHEDYLPEESLPTFNSCVIENSMHKIPGLSEHFVYFNDDILLNKQVKETDFFRKGLPRDILALQPVVANPSNPIMSYTFLNNSLLLARHFKKRDEMLAHPGRFFHVGYPVKYFVYNVLELCFPQITGFYSVHGAAPFLKSTFETVWAAEEDALREQLKNRFRGKSEINQYVFREWQKLTGNFVPGNTAGELGYYEIGENNDKLIRDIKKHKSKTICINDVGKVENEERVKRELIEAFESVFPKKSAFEK